MNTCLLANGSNADAAISRGVIDGFGTSNSNNEYEVGIVLEWTDFKNPNMKDLTEPKDILTKIQKENSDSFNKLKRRIQDALAEYMKWFTGDGTVNENELV